MNWEGISDLTSTEGNLKNYTRICHLFNENKLEGNELINQIKLKKQINRKSVKVIQRHLSILKHLKIITKDLGHYRLDTNGKILYALTKTKKLANLELSEAEAAFYFRILLTEKSLPQLLLLLYTIHNNNIPNNNEIIQKYYENYLKTSLSIWNRVKLRNRLSEYYLNGTINRSEKNRFDCMRYWLQQIKLINKYQITKAGVKLITIGSIGNLNNMNWQEYRKKIIENNTHLYTLTCSNKFVQFDIRSKHHNKLFNQYLKKGYELFGNKTLKTINWNIIETWISIKLLLNNKVYISSNEIYSFIIKLYNLGIVKSVIPGDYYKEKMIKIDEDNF